MSCDIESGARNLLLNCAGVKPDGRLLLIGDQIRFSQSPGNSTKVMAYTQSREHLGSLFAMVDYRMMQRIHDHLLTKIKGSKTCSIDSANGASLSAELPGQCFVPRLTGYR